MHIGTVVDMGGVANSAPLDGGTIRVSLVRRHGSKDPIGVSGILLSSLVRPRASDAFYLESFLLSVLATWKVECFSSQLWTTRGCFALP
jgi:hypothetical protein